MVLDHAADQCVTECEMHQSKSALILSDSELGCIDQKVVPCKAVPKVKLERLGSRICLTFSAMGRVSSSNEELRSSNMNIDWLVVDESSTLSPTVLHDLVQRTL